MKKLITMLAVAGTILLGGFATTELTQAQETITKTQQQDQEDKEMELIRQEAEEDLQEIIKSEEGNTLARFNNGNFAYITADQSKIEYTILECGDWNFELESIADLEKVILSYYIYDSMAATSNLYVQDQFITESGNNITEFNNGSFAAVNHETNTYEFTPGECGDWTIEVEGTTELEKVIKTYMSIKNNGYY